MKNIHLQLLCFNKELLYGEKISILHECATTRLKDCLTQINLINGLIILKTVFYNNRLQMNKDHIHIKKLGLSTARQGPPKLTLLRAPKCTGPALPSSH